MSILPKIYPTLAAAAFAVVGWLLLFAFPTANDYSILENRIVKIEVQLQHIPTAEDVHQLSVRLARVEETLAQILEILRKEK